MEHKNNQGLIICMLQNETDWLLGLFQKAKKNFRVYFSNARKKLCANYTDIVVKVNIVILGPFLSYLILCDIMILNDCEVNAGKFSDRSMTYGPNAVRVTGTRNVSVISKKHLRVSRYQFCHAL